MTDDRAKQAPHADDRRPETAPLHIAAPLRLSRRRFLQRGAVTVATAGVGAAITSCDPSPSSSSNDAGASQQPATTNITTSTLPNSTQFPEVPETPMSPPPANVLHFFTPHEAQTVDALCARILPGTPDDPGAREAGVVTFIDNLLATNDGFAEPTYRQPPYVQTYTGSAPPQQANSGSYEIVWVAQDQVERYGYQSILTPRDVFRMGVPAVDAYANQKFHHDFVDLSEQQQDQIIDDMVNDKATGFYPNLTGLAFFQNLRRYTMEGMFCDPVYGGNQGMIGWKLVGYPGAQRAYDPSEFQREGTNRQPMSIADMEPFNPGVQQGKNVILPVSGTNQTK